MKTKLHRAERPTTIKGLTELRRPQIIGTVRIGERVIGCKKCKAPERTYEEDEKTPVRCPSCGNTNTDKNKGPNVYTRPNKLDHFKIKPEDDRLAPLIIALYGDEPKAIDVKLPVYVRAAGKDLEPEVELEAVRAGVFPQSLTYFLKSGLQCSGDGERAVRYIDDPGGVEVACPGEKCAYYEQGLCRPSAQLYVYLYGLPAFGAFRLSTWSWNTIVDINTGLDNVFGIAEMLAARHTTETVATLLPKLPLVLRLKKGRGRDETGKPTVFYKVGFDLGASLLSLLASSQLELGAAAGKDVFALPAAKLVEDALNGDVDARRTDLLTEIKSLPPYKLDDAAFVDGRIEYDKVAAHAGRAANFTEQVIGRRETRLDLLTTEELEKLRKAQELLVNGADGSAPAGDIVTEAELDAAFDQKAEDIRLAEADALIGLIKRLGLKAGEVARFANEHFKPREKWTGITQKEIRENWSIDASFSLREHLGMLFAEALRGK